MEERLDLNKLSFYHPLFMSGPLVRSLSRIISYAFFIVFVGCIFAFFISDFPPLGWLGILLLLFLLDFIFHFNSAKYSLDELLAGKVPKSNVALCLNRGAIKVMISAIERVDVIGGSLKLALVLFLMEKDEIISTLKRLEIDSKRFKTKIEEALNKNHQAKNKKDTLAEAKEIVVRAGNLNLFHLQKEIDNESLLVSVCLSEDSEVLKILDLFEIKPNDVSSAISFSRFLFSNKFKMPATTGGFALKYKKLKIHRVNRSLTSRPTPILDQFSNDLTDLARMGNVGFLIGHQKEYEVMIDILSRHGSRNSLLVGLPGVGKEALVNHLAFQIINDNVPPPLFDRRLVELSVSSLISGASFEELSLRFKKIVDEINSAGNIILYIPDVHLLAKTSEGQGLELSDMLMPVLASNLFPVIGSTYPNEFNQFIKPSSEFSSLFEVLKIEEIKPEEASILLSYDAMVLEKEYGVEVNFSAIKKSVDLAYKYLKNKPLPSSAQDILKETLSEATQRNKKEIGGKDVIEIVERKVNIPIHKTSSQEAAELLDLEKVIHRQFIDQENAVKAVSRSLRNYRAGLSKRNGPIASFLFVGPTGVGKTELSKILTKIHFGSEKLMSRFDMSEFQQKEDIVRFIGSPDGKIAGRLTEAVIHSPYSLILLDEFEKANPEILNLFLQVFDEGRLTDGTGKLVDFQNTIIIATSNADSNFIQESILAGKKVEEFADEIKKRLSKYFKPELINRFSEAVVFRPLSREDIVKIALLNLRSLAETLSEAQGISISFSPEVVDKISQIGYEPSFGARPLKRAIDDNIKSALSEKILAGDVLRGDEISVVLDDSGNFDFLKNKS